MAKILKHDEEHLDGTRGAWRPTLQAKKSSFGPDNHAQDWDEGVVVSCPSCGCQFGVGFDKGPTDPRIGADGKTDRPVKCQNQGCPWMEVMEFDKHAESEGREHFAKMKDAAKTEIQEARVRVVHERIAQQMQAEIHDRAMAEAKKVIADGDPDQAKKLVEFMKTAKKIG